MRQTAGEYMKNELCTSLSLIALGGIQTLFSLPHVYLTPWTCHMPFVFSHAWVAWFFSTFDVARAIDFFPAIVLFAAGMSAAAVGIYQRVSGRMVEAAICFQTLAITIILVMNLAVPKIFEILSGGSLVAMQ